MYCSAKNFLTIRHVWRSVTASGVRLYRPAQRLSSFTSWRVIYLGKYSLWILTALYRPRSVTTILDAPIIIIIIIIIIITINIINNIVPSLCTDSLLQSYLAEVYTNFQQLYKRSRTISLGPIPTTCTFKVQSRTGYMSTTASKLRAKNAIL